MSNENVREMSPEQSADVAAIQAMIDQEQQAPGAEPAQSDTAQPEPVQADPAEAFAGLLTVASMAAGIVGMKRTAGIWNETACKSVAAAAIPVMQKYAWGQRFIVMLQTGAGVEEIALVMVAGPLIVKTAEAVRADLQEKKPEPEEKPAASLVPMSPSANAAMMPAGFSVAQHGGDFEVRPDAN